MKILIREILILVLTEYYNIIYYWCYSELLNVNQNLKSNSTINKDSNKNCWSNMTIYDQGFNSPNNSINNDRVIRSSVPMWWKRIRVLRATTIWQIMTK